MSLIARHQLPRIVERGVEQDITLDVYSSASVQQTATAGSLTIKLGSVVLVDSRDLSASLGPPASTTLSSALTASASLSDAWLELWSLTIGGQAYTFRRAGFLVRHAFYPTINDDDLTDRDGDLLNLVAGLETSLEKYRETARKKIERDLLRKGRRPWLIFDSYELSDAHIHLSLHYFYREQHTQANDSRYADAAQYHWDRYVAEFDAIAFRYDDDESGDIGSSEETPSTAAGPVVLTAAPRGARRLRWW